MVKAAPARFRRILFAGTIALPLVVVLVAALLQPSDPPARGLSASLLRAPASEAGTPPLSVRALIDEAGEGPVPEAVLCSVERIELLRGQTLGAALRQAGMDAAEVHRFADALGRVVDVRAFRPRDVFLLYRTREGVLDRLVYERGIGERVVLEARSRDLAAVRERDPREVTLRKISGTISSSLYLGLIEAGGTPALVDGFADLFAWDFDFTTDTRNGDRFEILVQEERVGGLRIGFGSILAGRYEPLQGEPLAVFGHGTADDEWAHYTADGRSIRKFFLKSPLTYRRISSHFSHRRFHPILKKYRPHLGVDYAAPSGTPVVALGGGKVESVGWRGGYGRTVRIDHPNGILTQYAHLAGYAKGIKTGARVAQGQVIGFVGSSGLSTGPHLDFRVQRGKQWINPLDLEGGESPPLPRAERAAFEARVRGVLGLLERLEPGEGVALGEPGAPGHWLAAAGPGRE